MELKIKKGYVVYTADQKEPMFVTPHSGPALESPVYRDDNSETVASLCWKKMGGTLIIGNMSRIRSLGIDFNRDIPDKESALKHFKNFDEEDFEKMKDFKKKYAFVAFDEKDYEERLKIYQNFWSDVEKGRYIVFIHRSFPKMSSVPSVMDVVTFKGEGIKTSLIREIVRDLNTKYYDFFQKIDKDYKQGIVSETRRMITVILNKYNSFDMSLFDSETKEIIEKDLVKVEMYGDKEVVEKLKNNFTPQTYLEAIENALKNIPEPQITIEHIFDGSKAFGPRRKLLPLKNKTILSVEPSRFMNFWHPQTTADIIIDIMSRLNN